MNQNRIFLLSFLLSLMCAAQAQTSLQARLEIQLNDGYGNEKIYKTTRGFFVMESTADKNHSNRMEMKYVLFDKDLHEQKTTLVAVPEELKNAHAYNDDQYIYKLYKDRKQKFLFTRINIENLHVDTVYGMLPPKIDLLDMKVVGHKAWFQAKQKSKTCILQLDILTGENRISEFIEERNGKKTNVVNYQMSPGSGELLVFMNKYIKRGVCELSQMRVNGSCELCNKVQLTGTGDKVISSVSGCPISANSMVYTGTYSRYKTDKSEGLFFAKADSSKLSYIKYVNFDDMKNFIAHESSLSQTLFTKIKNLFKKLGKEINRSYNIAAHDVIVIPNGFLLVGEAYYPSYSQIPYTSTMLLNGITTTHTYYSSVFNGYRYTHAFVAAFSTNGDLLWDQCFDMSPAELPKTPRRFIRISEKDEKHIGLVYTNGEMLVSKSIQFDGTVEKNQKIDLINTGNTSEKVSRTISSADYWYDNHFLIWGRQRVKNTDEKSKRDVFYVNKIVY